MTATLVIWRYNPKLFEILQHSKHVGVGQLIFVAGGERKLHVRRARRKHATKLASGILDADDFAGRRGGSICGHTGLRGAQARFSDVENALLEERAHRVGILS